MVAVCYFVSNSVISWGVVMYLGLGERERQIIEALYQREPATVQEVLDALESPPTYSTVRAMLGKLEQKGLVRHEVDGPRYLYRAVVGRKEAQLSAVRRILRALFNGSTERAVATLLDVSDLSEAELDRLEAMIADHRRSGSRRGAP